MTPTRHPICTRDASYYWYGGMHLNAMLREHVPFEPQPPFRVADEIVRTKPALIDTYFLKDVLPTPAMEQVLRQDYVLIKSDRLGTWAWLRKDLVVR